MLNRARNQSSFLQGRGSIISLSQQDSITHLLLSAPGPLPRGPVVGWALEAPLSKLAEFCGVSPGFAAFPLQGPVLEGARGRARAVGSRVPSAC